MKRFLNIGKRRKAFSMAEMLVVMLILAIVLIAATPVAVRRVMKDTVRPEHGSFECYYGHNAAGVFGLIERTRNANGDPIDQHFSPYDFNNPPARPLSCSFTPAPGAMFFTVNAVGGGSPGTGTAALFTDLPQHGVDYTNTFFKFHSFLINPYERDGANINFADLGVPGRLDTPSPLQWLNRDGVTLVSMLRSKGGDFTSPGRTNPCTTGGAAYVVKFRNTNCQDTAALNWNDLRWNASTQQFESTQKAPWSANPCFKIEVFPGTNPGKGKTITMTNTLRNGSFIKSSSYNGMEEPYFVVGNNGCQVKPGENGKFKNNSSCVSANGSAVSYEGSVCSGYRDDYGDVDLNYPSNRITLTSKHPSNEEQQAVGLQNPLTGPCYWQSPGVWSGDETGCAEGTSTIQWKTSTALDAPNQTWEYWYLYTIGNFVLASERTSSGLNFYAQSGNPGEYRTLYVSRFKKSITIVPGEPKIATASSQPGNDTVICYPDAARTCGANAERLLTVPGGKQPVNNAHPEDTFIMGSLFNLSQNQVVGAYDTIDTISQDAYSNYFQTKRSAFVYPIPDRDNPIPENIGQGGHGGYTIYRLTGITDAYEMRRPRFTSSGVDTLTSPGVNPVQVLSDYTCQRERLNGANDPLNGYSNDSHYCYPGDGFGGAVVLSW